MIQNTLIRPSPARPLAALALLTAAILLAGCGTLGASGPTRSAILDAGEQSYAEADIRVVDLDQPTIRRAGEVRRASSFAQTFGDSAPSGTVFGRGDTIAISIWEAPPAVLFGSAAVQSAIVGAAAPQGTNLPEQMVSDNGTVSVPFVGSVQVADRTAVEVEREIVERLQGRAHQPQAVVRLANNATRNVTVLGDVRDNRRVPLSATGERLLDAIAAAGGTRNPVERSTVQLARAQEVTVMPITAVIADPVQNVRLQPNDVITVFHQPFSFTAMGAVTQGAQVPFEGSGLTLAQAIGRVGGLRDDRADIRGVFIFRFEDPAVLDPTVVAAGRRTAEGRVPVIYRVDLSDPASFFAAQDFNIRDEDILYVSTAPLADLQRFLGAVSNIALSAVAIQNATQ